MYGVGILTEVSVSAFRLERFCLAPNGAGLVARVSPLAGRVDSRRLPLLQPERSFFSDSLELGLDQCFQVGGQVADMVGESKGAVALGAQ